MAHRVDKPLRAAETFGPVPSSFGTMAHGHHRVRRAALNAHFSKRSVGELCPWIEACVEQLCRRFEGASVRKGKEAGEVEVVINLKYAFAAMSLDVIYEYCFSRRLGSLERLDFGRGYVDALEEGFCLTPIVSCIGNG